MASPTSITHSMSSGDLIAELASLAPRIGGNAGEWPGLTVYRFTEPLKPQWEEIQSMSLGIVAQGRKAVVVEGERLIYDSFNYLVLADRLNFTAEIVEATVRRPFLSLVLQIDPSTVRKIASEMVERTAVLFPDEISGAEQRRPAAFVSNLDADMMSAVLRFLAAVRSPSDRRVLAPLCVDELVYRILQREQYNRLLALAAREPLPTPSRRYSRTCPGISMRPYPSPNWPVERTSAHRPSLDCSEKSPAGHRISSSKRCD